MGFECFASGLDSVGSSCLRSWTSATAVPYLWPLATVTVLGIGSAPRRYSCHSRHGSRCWRRCFRCSETSGCQVPARSSAGCHRRAWKGTGSMAQWPGYFDYSNFLISGYRAASFDAERLLSGRAARSSASSGASCAPEALAGSAAYSSAVTCSTPTTARSSGAAALRICSWTINSKSINILILKFWI